MAPFDSYKELLIHVCTLFQPKNVLEYGPGDSTAVFLEYSDAHIHSIEHDLGWFEKAEKDFDGNLRVNIHLIQDHEDYITSDFGKKYDMIYVDGLCAWRVDCLKKATEKLAPDGYVILHDSERQIYNKGKELYKEILEIKGTTLYQPLSP